MNPQVTPEHSSMARPIDELRSRLDLVWDSTHWVTEKLDGYFEEDAEARGELPDMACMYVDLRVMHDEAKEIASKLYELRRRVGDVELPRHMEAHNIERLKLKDVGTFTPTDKFTAKALDKPKAMDWLREQEGGGALITETVNHNSLTAFLRRHLEDTGVDPPKELFELGSYKTTSFRKT